MIAKSQPTETLFSPFPFSLFLSTPFQLGLRLDSKIPNRTPSQIPMFSAAAGLVSLQERYSSDSNVALDRIESLAFNFIHDMMNERHEGAVQMLNRTYNNLMEHPESGALLFGDKITTRKLSARTARTVARMLEVVMTMQNLLLSGRRISQRELFYMLIGSFDTQAQLNKIILDVSAMLGVPRYALNIGAATRGVMAGNICIATSGSIYKVDCEHVGAVSSSAYMHVSSTTYQALQSTDKA